jgi:hypothetical protein
LSARIVAPKRAVSAGTAKTARELHPVAGEVRPTELIQKIQADLSKAPATSSAATATVASLTKPTHPSNHFLATQHRPSRKKRRTNILPGCRKGDYNGCRQTAANVQTACLIAARFVPGASIACEITYRASILLCDKLNSKEKRDPEPFTPSLTERDPAQACSMGNVFQLSDMDQSGNITIDEYLMFANWTSKGMLNTAEDFAPWVSYFHSFDADGDGFIVSGEYERA